MSPLTPASAAALSRLRTYRPPPTTYARLPLPRRAAVLLLLYADTAGDLRVVLTLRAAGMATYAGHAALPGGRADSLAETAWATARREAWEEIGLPMGDELPRPWKVERLCEMPVHLARTELGVRPCVAFLGGGEGAEEVLRPRLEAQEVAAVFSAPFRNFLRAGEEVGASAGEEEAGVEAAGWPARWYRGVWTEWHEARWRMHNFYVPVRGQGVAWAKGMGKKAGGKEDAKVLEKQRGGPSNRSGKETAAGGSEDALSDPPKTSLADLDRFRVFGMTARILVDAARVAYDEEPEFEHNAHFGDEDMVARLLKMGRLSPERKKGEFLTRAVMKEAAKL